MDTVRAVRIALGLLYAAGALIHLYFILYAPGLYELFAEVALVATYRELWLSLVVPNRWILLPIVVLLEAGVAAGLLWRGRVVTVANVAGAIFQFGLVLSGPWGILNLGLAGVHLYLARIDFPEPAIRRREGIEAES